MPSLAYGEYKLSVSSIGYNNLDTTFRVSAPKLNLGVLKLKPGVQIRRRSSRRPRRCAPRRKAIR